MSIVLADGIILDPVKNAAYKGSVVIDDGEIMSIGSSILKPDEVIDVSGKFICPSFMDMHVHFRTPGQCHKETIGSGSLAALAGGFTSVLAMANTSPTIDNKDLLRQTLMVAENNSHCWYYQAAAATRNLDGESITNIEELKKQGAIAISDDGKAIQDEEILRHVLKHCAEEKIPFLVHCEDYQYPCSDPHSEYVYIDRLIDLSAELRVAVHIQHVSTARSVALIRQAKEKHLKVTCETCPHYFTLTEKALDLHGANAKMNPPLRKESDRQAIIKGLVDGTIDVIATDHAPHSPQEKSAALDKAPSGIIGLETAVAVSFSTLKRYMTPLEIVKKITINPANILGFRFGFCHEAPANIVVIDPGEKREVNPESFYSLARNCPWVGKELSHWPCITIKNGKIVMRNGEIFL
jgi:dihydroorotase